jgi:hypothetical protein
MSYSNQGDGLRIFSHRPPKLNSTLFLVGPHVFDHGFDLRFQMFSHHRIRRALVNVFSGDDISGIERLSKSYLNFS